MNYGKLAGFLGVVSGIEVLLGSLLVTSFAYPYSCTNAVMFLGCSGVQSYESATGGFGVLLALASLANLLGFRVFSYVELASGIIVALLLTLVMVTGVESSLYFSASVALCLASSALSFVSARSKGGLSEQANPMNLPVFG